MIYPTPSAWAKTLPCRENRQTKSHFFEFYFPGDKRTDGPSYPARPKSKATKRPPVQKEQVVVYRLKGRPPPQLGTFREYEVCSMYNFAPSTSDRMPPAERRNGGTADPDTARHTPDRPIRRPQNTEDDEGISPIGLA